MAITEKTREEFKRIAKKRIDTAIKKIRRENRSAYSELEQQAAADAVEAMELGAFIERAQDISDRDQLLKDDRDKLAREINTHLKENGYLVQDRWGNYRHGLGYINGPKDVRSVTDSLSEELLHDLLSEHDLLKNIALLQDERDRLDEAILIATSQTQVRELMQGLTDLLGEAMGELESVAMDTDPYGEDND